MVNGDVPGNDPHGGGAAGGNGDEAEWLDLVARFDGPVPASADGTAPWPEREELGAPALPPLNGGPGPRDTHPPEDPADDHYIPPPPPPLPKLDPVTKGAWLALFGGPLYLLIATAIGVTVTGLAAFLAVAAFVGGFVVLVFRMDNGGPRDSGPDDGAVV